jgi:hypothetical protein
VGHTGGTVQQGEASPSGIVSTVDTIGDMDADLDELLAGTSVAASSVAGQSRTEKRGELKKPAMSSSLGVARLSRGTTQGSQAANRCPAKNNVQDAKAALKDWLDL